MRLFSGRNRNPAHNPVQIREKGGIRYLHLGNATVHSAMRIAEPEKLELAYTRAITASLLFVPEARRITIIGLGGGSLAKFFHAKLPLAKVMAVEINPQVADAAHGHFFLPAADGRLDIVVGDGARHIPENPASCDILILDGFDTDSQSQPLASEAFYSDGACALLPGGMLAVNLWGSDPGFGRYVRRLETVFAHRVLRLPVERRSNVIVFAFPWHSKIPAWSILTGRARELEALHSVEYSRFLEMFRANNPGAFG
jgi:spermidine synthase